jgi:acetyl esterase/lipase
MMPLHPSIPWIFLAVTLVGAAFTWNAYFPRRARSALVVPSFFAGWLTSELAAHHFFWQMAATVVFVWAGALAAWPGWLGLAITVASWAALLALLSTARRSGPAVDEALDEALGPGWEARLESGAAARLAAPPRFSRMALPLWLTDPAVRVERNLRYAPGAGRRHLLDVYYPREGARDAPVLFQVHGGGWTIGDKRQQALPLMLHLAACGWVCVAANYRLSPRATFPDHLIDLKQALAWVRTHVAEYGGDPAFVAVTGGSAGGHLSALLALTAGDPAYQPGFESADTTVQACVPFYGIYDVANRCGMEHFPDIERFLGRFVLKRRFAEDREAFVRASPVEQVNPGAPPFFVIHGTHDSLAPVGEARCFVRRLRAVSRAPVAYAEIPGAQHAFEVFHSLRTRYVVSGVARFLGWAHVLWRGGRAQSALSGRSGQMRDTAGPR